MPEPCIILILSILFFAFQNEKVYNHEPITSFEKHMALG